MKSSKTAFFLPFKADKASYEISIRDEILLLGSCFAENIGRKLTENKFKALVNPAGTIYNPISIFRLIRNSLNGEIDHDLVIQNEEIFYHWGAHSAISGSSQDELILNYQQMLTGLKQWLTNTSILILSPGTSWIYKHLKTNSIVANCHKVKQKEFERSLLTADEIQSDYFSTLKEVRGLNPGLKVILTVSPIRHVRDGLVQNNVSKSILIQAINEIIEEDELATYFPSYEIMIDVLRDYRFYEEDMIHPNSQAIQYIWNEFAQSFFANETKEILQKWMQVSRSLNHKPLQPESKAYTNFLESTLRQLMELKPVLDVKSEIDFVNSQLETR